MAGGAEAQVRARLMERNRALLEIREDTEEALALLEQGRPHEWSEEAQGEALASLLQKVDERVWQALPDIEKALPHVQDGNYGICESCGSAIDPKRWNALPTARFCITCQDVARGA